MTGRGSPMWNRATGPKGFDTDAVLPYRERLIVVYVYTERRSGLGERISSGVGEAYVDNGKWYWWDNTNTTCKAEVQSIYEIKTWTRWPVNS